MKRINRYVLRAGSDKYFLLMLISFALSVSLTRAFLNLTGFPQLGNNELHIAHVLWGGLFLFVSSILPLLFANRWVYSLGAILSGIGVGLFIDEVGKFITQTNNYFYPPAAPIIYGFFLITVFLYTRIKRQPSRDDRTELYHTLDVLEEVLEHELDSDEREELINSLERVRSNTTHEDYRRLTEELLQFLNSPGFAAGNRIVFFSDYVHLMLNRARHHFISNRTLHYFCAFALILLGLFTILLPFRFVLSMGSPERLTDLIEPLITSRLVISSTGMDWFSARLALEASVGILLIISGVFLLLKWITRGLSLAYLGLLLIFTTVDLLIFYFDQFSTIFFVTIQLIVFLGVTAYQKRIKEMNLQ